MRVGKRLRFGIELLLKIPGMAVLARNVANRTASRHRVGVTGVILNADGNVLLGCHRFRGEEWALIGGWVRAHEHPEAAIIREALEETGMDIRVDGILASESHVEGIGNRGTSGITIGFRCRTTTHGPLPAPDELSVELTRVSWVRPDEAVNLLNSFEGRLVELAGRRMSVSKSLDPR